MKSARYGLLVLLAAASAAAADVQVTVDASTRLQINGVDQIQDGLFGVDGLGNTHQEWTEKANMHTNAGGSIGLEDMPEDPQHPGRNDPAFIEKSLKNIQVHKGYRYDHFIHVAQGGPGWNMRPDCGMISVRPEATAEWVATAAKFWDLHMPETRHYFMIQGEISLLGGNWTSPQIVRDPTREGTNTTGTYGASYYVDVLEATCDRVHRDGVRAMVGSAGLTCSLNWTNWRTWRSWWEQMIDRAGDKVDFYGIHWYDFRDAALVAEATLIQNAQELRWGDRKPIVCQESDHAQGTAYDPEKGLYTAYYLWSLLDMPDKVIVDTAHLIQYREGFSHNMFRNEGPLARYWAYWIMRDLRGTMLNVNVDPGPTSPMLPDRKVGGMKWLFPQHRGIKARAGMQGGRIGLVVFNDDKQVQSVKLAVSLPKGSRAVSVQASKVDFDKQAGQDIKGEECEVSHHGTDKGLAVEWNAEPLTIYAVTIELDQAVKPGKLVWQREYFGDQIMFNVPGPTTATNVMSNSPSAFTTLDKPGLRVKLSRKGAKSAHLRVALNKARGDWEDTLVRINGKLHSLPVREHVKTVAVTEVPVDVSCLSRKPVAVEFLPHVAEPYQVLWASLVLSNAPGVEPATIIAHVQGGTSGIAPGEIRSVSYTVQNPSRRRVKAKTKWVLPDGWSVTDADNEMIEIRPKRTFHGKMKLQCADDPLVEYQQVAMVVDTGEHRVTARRSYRVDMPIVCRKFGKPPAIDGDLADWQDKPANVLRVGDHDVQFRTGWDRDNFYFAAKIPTAGKAVPVNERIFHILLDLGNEKGIFNMDANDHQFWLTTPGPLSPAEAMKAQWFAYAPPGWLDKASDDQKKEVLRHPGYVGTTLWQGTLEKQVIAPCPNTAMASKALPDAYTLEARISKQAMYGYWPVAGDVIGFDVVCDASALDPDAPAYYWGKGFERLHSYYFFHPREQVRGNPAWWGLMRFSD